MTPAVLLLLASFSYLGAGTLLARTLRPEAGAAERFLAGFLVVSLMETLLGAFGLLSPVWVALPVAFAPWGFLSLRAERPARAATGIFPGGMSAWGGLLAIVAIWALALAGLPPHGADALTYHLNLPNQYLLRGSIAVPDGIAYYRYTQAYETGILPLVAWDPTGVAANLLQIPILLALLAGAHRLAARGDGSVAAAIAAAAAATAPITMLLVLQSKNDLLAAALLLWGVAALWEEENLSTRASAWGGFLLGGAVAVKVSHAIVVLPLLLALAPRGIRRTATASIACFVAPIFWIGRNLIQIGAPLPPLLSKGPEFSLGAWAADLGPRLEELLGSFLHFRMWNIEGPIGILLLLLPLAGLARILPSPRLRPVALASLAALVLWTFASWRWWRMGQGQSRFLLPVLYILLPFGAAAVAEKRISRIAVLVAMLFSLYEGARLTRHRFLHDLTTFLNSYPVLVRSSELPVSSSTLSVGESRLFYFRRRVAFDGYWERPRVWDWAHEEGHDSAALHARLRRAGFTHLLLNPGALEFLQGLGEIPPARCARDTPTLEALVASLSPVIRHPDEPEVALYALDAAAVSSPR